MSSVPTKFQVSNLIAACVVGASLIASAQIVARRPMPASVNPRAGIPVNTDGAKAVPPLAQESVQKQFREQVLAAPALHLYRHNNKVYTLADVKVTQVIYTAKADEFTVRFEWKWKEGNPLKQSWSSSSSLFNDGYGHYYGIVVLSPIVGGSGQNAEVTIR